MEQPLALRRLWLIQSAYVHDDRRFRAAGGLNLFWLAIVW